MCAEAYHVLLPSGHYYYHHPADMLACVAEHLGGTPTLLGSTECERYGARVLQLVFAGPRGQVTVFFDWH